jgi:hypothetical protein
MLTDASDLSQPVRAVTAGREGSVWAGTDNGLYPIRRRTTTHFDRRDGLAALSIGALYTDHKGTIWVAADHGGIAQFKNGRFATIAGSQAKLKRVWAITGDEQDALWMCEVDAGLFRWSDGILNSFSADPEVGGRFCNAAVTDHAGRVCQSAGWQVIVRDGERFRSTTGRTVYPARRDRASRGQPHGGSAPRTGWCLSPAIDLPPSSVGGNPHTNVRAILGSESYGLDRRQLWCRAAR